MIRRTLSILRKVVLFGRKHRGTREQRQTRRIRQLVCTQSLNP